jgi:hypothetical protein
MLSIYIALLSRFLGPFPSNPYFPCINLHLREFEKRIELSIGNSVIIQRGKSWVYSYLCLHVLGMLDHVLNNHDVLFHNTDVLHHEMTVPERKYSFIFS